jgi:putative membrane protein
MKPWKAISAALGFLLLGLSPAVAADTPLDPKEYVTEASQSDAAEIKISEMALRTSENAAVKKFATEMVEAHKTSTEKLKTAAGQAGVADDVTDTPSVQQTAAAAKLEVLTGEAFDREFASIQVKAHEEALKLHSGYAKTGKAGPLKTLASALVPTIQQHLKMAQNLSASLKKK